MLYAELIASMEAGVDFAEDDVSVLPGEEIQKRIAAYHAAFAGAAPLLRLRKNGARGPYAGEMSGRPNVGKSSLLIVWSSASARS